jgi:hypothetical protein
MRYFGTGVLLKIYSAAH